jgi:hypothetical protein
MSEFITNHIGHALTQHKRHDFDEIVKKYSKFVSISQFVTPPSKFDASKDEWGIELLDYPRMDYGSQLFGLEENGSLTLLGSIIDSSD